MYNRHTGYGRCAVYVDRHHAAKALPHHPIAIASTPRSIIAYHLTSILKSECRSHSGHWEDAFPVATAKAGFTRFLCLVFTGEEAFPLMAGGIKAVSFFDHTEGSRGLRRKRGVFG